MLMFRRNCHYKIGSSIIIPHIILCLNEMLGKCGTDLTVSIFMELENTLRFCTITKPFICKCLGKNLLTVFRTFTGLLAEKVR